MDNEQVMSRILTGLKPNANLHLGNYLGAVIPMVRSLNNLSTDDEMFMFIPNLHAITIATDYHKIPQNTVDNVKMYMAAGFDVDHKNLTLYRQSYVSAHAELAWILSCFTYYGEAQRMTQFKDKSSKNEQVTVGLFTYPILMAADILLYGAHYIPLGDDQRQHVELARDIAIRMNNKFETELFTVPEPWNKQLEFMGLKEGVRIRSLSRPESKMSKSENDPKGTITLSDDPAEAAKKIMSATTDSIGVVNWDWENQPGITNLMQILALLENKENEEVVAQWTGCQRYGDLKKAVATAVEVFLINFQEKLSHISDEKVFDVLQQGERKAQQIATKTLLQVQQKVGLR